MLHSLDDFSTSFSAIFFRVAKNRSASFEADALLILTDGACGTFSDSKKIPYYSFK
jgi:hypothetical protein